MKKQRKSNNRDDRAADLLAKASVFHRASNLDEAEAIHRTVLAENPNHVDALILLGFIQVQRENLAEGLRLIEEALTINPRHVEAYYNRGLILQMMGRYSDALASYEQAIAIDPTYIGAQWHKGIMQLTLGNFEQGWQQYEWRWKTRPEKIRHFDKPIWLGIEPLAGKTLLVHAEQGFGDTIQFCRYIPMLEALGAKVIFEVQAELMGLISTLKGNYQLVEWGTPLPLFDLHCPLMSLPLACGTTIKTIPADVPYLSVPPQKQQQWQQRLGPKTKNRVGMVWSGLPTHANDHHRSIAPELFAPLLKFDFEFHLLQKDLRPQEVAFLKKHPHIKFHGTALHDFTDTAALIAQMDLVIAVDTSTAHLAGALGKPVWIMVSFVPDYRWMLEREDTPWYPTAKLLRQPKPGDWESVIAKLAV